MIHTIKILPQYWAHVHELSKKCEIRLNDRDYQTGDTLEFLVEDKDCPTLHLQDQKFTITHVTHFPAGLKEWYVALSISPLTE